MILLLLVAATLRMAVPLALAACGGSISERSGVINIALEGMMLMGAFGYALGAWVAAKALGIEGQEAGMAAHLAIAVAGLAAAVACGGLVGVIHALVSVRFRADQVVSGVALNLLAAGLSKFLLRLVFGSSSNSSWVFGLPAFPGLSGLSVLGSALGAPLLWVTIAVVAGAQLFLFRSVVGLRTRAVGEHPAAAESAGVSVAAIRWAAVVLSGVLAGLAGAWLAADQHQFTENMSAGRGYIALAAVIFGKWRPKMAALACLLFAGADGLQILLQGTGVPLPGQLLQVLPHVLALVVLAGAVGKATPPAAIGKAWPES